MQKNEIIIKIKGDASFRTFYRKIKNHSSSIIVKANREKKQNLVIYDAINRILIKNKILAPRLLSEKYNKNFIEIQDFGTNTIFNLLRKKKINLIKCFRQIIDILNRLQLIKDRRVKDFKKNNYRIPKYDKRILIKEASLFNEWYIKKNLNKKYQRVFNKKFKKIISKLCSNLKLKNNVLVHRDFHVSNLMIVKGKIGVIDSQDALIGNKAYDLASLIDDVRFKTSDSQKERIYNYYINNQKRINKNQFKNDFKILSVLRNLKIIGIFTRLAKRDGKKNYLKLIPYAWKLINLRLKKDMIFYELTDLFNQYLKKKIK
ncbi:MAG: phosphotransferase [Magnetovibrio sp.]|nr:phosphotransferase [Magnetovibrio sp.]